MLRGIVSCDEGEQPFQLTLTRAVVEQALNLLSPAHASAEVIVDRTKMVEAKGGQLLVAEGGDEQLAHDGGVPDRLARRDAGACGCLLIARRDGDLGRREDLAALLKGTGSASTPSGSSSRMRIPRSRQARASSAGSPGHTAQARRARSTGRRPADRAAPSSALTPSAWRARS